MKLNQPLNILLPTARDGGCGLAGKFIYGCCWVEGEAGGLDRAHTHTHFPEMVQLHVHFGSSVGSR